MPPAMDFTEGDTHTGHPGQIPCLVARIGLDNTWVIMESVARHYHAPPTPMRAPISIRISGTSEGREG